MPNAEWAKLDFGSKLIAVLNSLSARASSFCLQIKCAQRQMIRGAVLILLAQVFDELFARLLNVRRDRWPYRPRAEAPVHSRVVFRESALPRRVLAYIGADARRIWPSLSWISGSSAFSSADFLSSGYACSDLSLVLINDAQLADRHRVVWSKSQ